MSPIKKLLNRITGQELSEADQRRIRGFGKLPSSREFVHIDAWQEQARVYQAWVQGGHDRWVTRVDPQRRGRVTPAGLFARFPELDDLAVVASIWNSRDSAAPPRTFPFTLFALQAVPDTTWAAHLITCSVAWDQFSDLFGLLSRGAIGPQDVRDRPLQAPADPAAAAGSLQQDMQAIPFCPWIRGLAAAAQSAGAESYLQYLGGLLLNWRNQPHGFAARLPLSRSHPYRPQVAAWLQWLQTHLGDLDLTALLVPQNVPEAAPAVVLLTRPLSPADFQLLTTNAADCDSVDDAGRMPRGAALANLPEGLGRLLHQDAASVYDWSCGIE